MGQIDDKRRMYLYIQTRKIWWVGFKSNKITPDGHRENGRWKLGRRKYTGLRVYL